MEFIIKIVSYNLRFASEDDPQPWSRRRGPMVNLLAGLAPDVLGTEEGLQSQLADLADGLGPDYRLIAEPRHDGESEEHSAIFYNAATLELITVEHRWLSDTPEVPGSKTWGAYFPRMFSVATFRRRCDGAGLVVVTTHFDHAVEEAQLKSARLLRSVVEQIDPAIALVVMGDFNVGEDSEPYAVLTADRLRDAYLTADRPGPRLGTFNNYAEPDPDGVRIDWILVNDRVRVHSARMVDTAPGGQFPSDHLPVEAEIELLTD